MISVQITIDSVVGNSMILSLASITASDFIFLKMILHTRKERLHFPKNDLVYEIREKKLRRDSVKDFKVAYAADRHKMV